MKNPTKTPANRRTVTRPSVPTVSVADVMAWEPCSSYTESRVRELFGRRRRMTGEQILDLDIPIADRMWAVTHSPLLSERAARLFAADVAEHVLHLYERDYPQDGRPRAAIDAARRFARGEIGAAAGAAAGDAAGAAAGAAARDAARDAARAAAWAAAGAAAGAAARDAAGAAAWAAAWNAEREWQIAICRTYLRGEVAS